MTPVPSIALAIPAYGRPDYLARLLARVPADVRAFVSDNAASLRDSGMAVGGNVVVSASDSLLAMFANWNRALSLVPDDATHVLVPSDDDLYLPGAFARIADVIRAEPDADIFIFGCDLIDENDVPRKGYAPAEWRCFPPGEGFFRFARGVEARMPGIVFRKSFLDRIGGFDERFQLTAADSELVQRALLLGRSVFCPDVVACYRVWPGSLTHSRQATDEWMREVKMWVAKVSALWEATYGKGARGFDAQSFADEIVARNLMAGVRGLMARGEWRLAREFLRRQGIPRHARPGTLLRLWYCRWRTAYGASR